MYDRQRDFISFDNSNTKYFDSPRYELYVFFDTKSERWCYEIVDHNKFSLTEFNNGGGTLVKTSMAWCQSYLVEEILQNRFPDAMIAMYEDIDTWLSDREAGVWR